MTKSTFQDYICRPYCAFFKEGQKEDLACRGAEAASILVDRGLVDVGIVPVLEKESSVWERHKDALAAHVCRSCPFFHGDCDFQGEEQIGDAEPCGGFILLALWYENGLIQMADVE